MIFKFGFIKATLFPTGWGRHLSDRLSAVPDRRRSAARSGMLYGLLLSGGTGHKRDE